MIYVKIKEKPAEQNEIFSRTLPETSQETIYMMSATQQ